MKKLDEPLRLDLIAAETMGTEQDGNMEALLAANPGLADGGPYAAEGAVIAIPDPPARPALPVVNVWD